MEKVVWLSHRPTLPPNNVSVIVNRTASCQKWCWRAEEAFATAVADIATAGAARGTAAGMEVGRPRIGVLNALMNCFCSIIMVGWSARLENVVVNREESSGNDG